VEKLAHPGGLGHAIGHSAVLDLSTGAGDDRLPLGGPGDEVGAQEHSIARSGPARVGAAGPVGVGVDHKLRRRGRSKEEAIVDRASEVAQDALESGKMGCAYGGRPVGRRRRCRAGRR
jgi:hypothetical protein